MTTPDPDPANRLVLPHIARMTGYVPGEQPREEGVLKLNTNESPYPPSPAVLAAIRAAVDERLRLYPDPLATSLRERAGTVFGLDPDQVIVGNGSDDLLNIILRATVGPGEAIATPVPTYGLYATLATIQGARRIEVPFPDDWSLPPELASSSARLVFLANPNSPSGTRVPREVIRDAAKAFGGLFCVDEAYVDFTEEGCVDLVREVPNLIVVRTFSKSFSLAGVRLGFGFARPALIRHLLKVKDAYNVGRLGIAAGVAALEDIAVMRGHAARIRAERVRLSDALAALGFHVFPSAANFILARWPGGDAGPIHAALKARGVLVRHWSAPPRLADCLRITIGTPADSDRFLARLKEVLP